MKGRLDSKKARRARRLEPLKHGFYMKEAIAERKVTRKLIKQGKELINGI